MGRTFSSEAVHDQSVLKTAMSFISSSQQNTGQMAMLVIFVFLLILKPQKVYTQVTTIETSDMEMSSPVNDRLLNISVEEEGLQNSVTTVSFPFDMLPCLWPLV